MSALNDAIAAYREVLDRNPNQPVVRYRLASAYAAKGDRDHSAEEYRRFLALWKSADADVPEVVAAKAAPAGR